MSRRLVWFEYREGQHLFSILPLLLTMLLLTGCNRYQPTLVHNLNTTTPYTLVSDAELERRDRLQLMFLGNTNVYISDGTTRLLTDGFFSRPGGWLSVLLDSFEPDEGAIAKALQRAGIDKQLDAVLVGHTHYDHVMDAPLVAKETGALLLGSSSAWQVARSYGFPAARFIPMPRRNPFPLGDFTITYLPSRHGEVSFKPLAKLADGKRTEPLPTPAHFYDYKEGGVYAIHVAHPFGNVLVLTSSGYEPGALQGYSADTVFLSVAALGQRGEQYLRDYLAQTVETVKARTVVPVHWDDFTKPVDEPLIAVPNRITDVEQAMATLRQLEREARGRWHILWPPAFIKWLAPRAQHRSAAGPGNALAQQPLAE